MPHPEEPVGSLLLEHLLPFLADGLAEELGFGFSVVKVGDPDAMRLNETWFAEPYDLAAGRLLRRVQAATGRPVRVDLPHGVQALRLRQAVSPRRALVEVSRAEAEAKPRYRAPQLAAAGLRYRAAAGRGRNALPRAAAGRVAGSLEPVPMRTLVQCQLAALPCTLVVVREPYRPAYRRPPASRGVLGWCRSPPAAASARARPRRWIEEPGRRRPCG